MVILNEEQAALRSAARAFTDKELIPAAAELERGGTFPAALLRLASRRRRLWMRAATTR